MIPGLILIIAFSLLKTYVFSPEVMMESWFIYLNFAFFAACVIVPCVIYYLRTPPGIDHK